MEVAGTSLEGRELIFAKVSTNPENASNPIILINGGIHAREWIAPSVVLYILQELVENESNRGLLENVDWYLLPVLNPDGYQFSHTTVRIFCGSLLNFLIETLTICIDSSLEKNQITRSYLFWCRWEQEL